jgi:deoxyribodipyrimidine photo-lyase
MNDRQLRRDLADRAALEAYLRDTFVDRAAPGEALSPIRADRAVLDSRLDQVDPRRYAASRNRVDGAVTGLSPWIRHGIVTLAAIRDLALRRVDWPEQAEKLVSELAWRDYWQRVHAELGERIWSDLEPWKTGWRASDYADHLPPEVEAGTSGLACMDAFATELRVTGWLHNHARMWVAAWVVHWLRVRWQAGARWFLRHLLDGDLASNNLSWQWVASTFSAKPYIFNRENLERKTAGRFCATCARRDACPFDARYEALARELFPRLASAER